MKYIFDIYQFVYYFYEVVESSRSFPSYFFVQYMDILSAMPGILFDRYNLYNTFNCLSTYSSIWLHSLNISRIFNINNHIMWRAWGCIHRSILAFGNAAFKSCFILCTDRNPQYFCQIAGLNICLYHLFYLFVVQDESMHLQKEQ